MFFRSGITLENSELPELSCGIDKEYIGISIGCIVIFIVLTEISAWISTAKEA